MKESRLAKDDPVANCLPTGVASNGVSRERSSNGCAPSLAVGGRHSELPTDLHGREAASCRRRTRSDLVWPFNRKMGWGHADCCRHRGWIGRGSACGASAEAERLHVSQNSAQPMGTLENAITIDDPGAYSPPVHGYVSGAAAAWHRTHEIFLCNENNTIPKRISDYGGRGLSRSASASLSGVARLAKLTPTGPDGTTHWLVNARGSFGTFGSFALAMRAPEARIETPMPDRFRVP